jgi:hypothetical protein
LGSLFSVLFNIENKHYTKEVLVGIDFMNEFSSITKDELNKTKKLIRPVSRESIIHGDENRKPILTAFVEILETNEDPSRKLSKFG